MAPRINYFINRDGFHTFEIRHLFTPSYFDTVDELTEAYQPMIEWLNEHIKGPCRLSPLDNAAFSDVNEDPWVGYHVYFLIKEDAMAFKLRWIE